LQFGKFAAAVDDEPDPLLLLKPVDVEPDVPPVPSVPELPDEPSVEPPALEPEPNVLEPPAPNVLEPAVEPEPVPLDPALLARPLEADEPELFIALFS
jgi:hypothetical protein